jgi:hypothetical protein
VGRTDYVAGGETTSKPVGAGPRAKSSATQFFMSFGWAPDFPVPLRGRGMLDFYFSYREVIGRLRSRAWRRDGSSQSIFAKKHLPQPDSTF